MLISHLVLIRENEADQAKKQGVKDFLLLVCAWALAIQAKPAV